MSPTVIIEISKFLAEEIAEIHKGYDLQISLPGIEYKNGYLTGSSLGSRARYTSSTQVNFKLSNNNSIISSISIGIQEGFKCCGMLNVWNFKYNGFSKSHNLNEIVFKFLDIICLNYYYTSYSFIVSVENPEFFEYLKDNHTKIGLSVFNSFLNERATSKNDRHECILYGKNLNFDNFIVYLHEKNECKKQREQLRETSSTGIESNGIPNSNNEAVVASLGQSIS
jgi:hypothetical protein